MSPRVPSLAATRRHRSPLLLIGGLSICAIPIAAACSTVTAPPDVLPGATGTVSVEVSYNHDLLADATDTLHVFVVSSKDGSSIDCNKLVSGEMSPYDGNVARTGEKVFKDPSAELEVEALVGEGFVYVEAIDFSGRTHLAGCNAIDVEEGETASAQVTVVTAGSYDCDAKDTKDGSPCDDGRFCTTGETCDGGTCTDGRTRDCASNADDCRAGTCNEDDGCILENSPDDTPCDDGLTCTTNDACQDGECLGAALDCSQVTPGICQYGGSCVEGLGCTGGNYMPSGTACDNGEYCMTGSECNGAGSCGLNERIVLCDYSYCAPTATCSEASQGCTVDAAAAAARQGLSCDDNPCIDPYEVGMGGAAGVGASCDGNGNCTGGTPLSAGTSCTLGCRTGTCDGSGTCNLAANLPDDTACSGVYSGSYVYTGTCVAGECAL